MRIKFLILVSVVLTILVPTLSASHFVIGFANDAEDSTSANGRTVVLWNPDNGITDNITDVIGITGNSGADNVYMIDCELLDSGCSVGDLVKLKIINDTDDYVALVVILTITGAGYDIAPNLTLNTPPNLTKLNYPGDYSNHSGEVNFNCSATDLDFNLANITLYGNWSFGWHANETLASSGNFSSIVFTKNLSEGVYEWNCLVQDNMSISRFYENNFTLTIDRTKPVVDSVYINETYACGNRAVRVNCTATDVFTDINNVLIEAIRPAWRKNYSASLFLGDTYYADVLINETGNWTFNCIANDSAGNEQNFTKNFSAYSGIPDLLVFSSQINFSNLTPMEGQTILIEAIVHNNGCGNANDFLVGFFEGDPSVSALQINGNQTISVSELSNTTVNVSWDAKIGNNNIFVSVDLNESISEANEDNNIANKTLDVTAWQEFFGNITADKLLSDSLLGNMSFWFNYSNNLQGNIFITDFDSDVDWLSLQSIGRNVSNLTTGNDFTEVDILLNMGDFEDSVSDIFTKDGNTPKKTDAFLIHQKVIENVPIINSTDNENFITGILWDTSDDDNDGSFDGEYSQGDAEDLVFVSKINRKAAGAYGNYDYEIRIPVRLRNYDSADSTNVYLYYDLV